MIQKLIDRGYLCLMATALAWAGAGCSKQEEPAPYVPAAQAIKQTATSSVPGTASTETAVDKTWTLFSEYMRMLKAGDLLQASATLTTLKGLLRGEDLNDPFWADNLPAEKRLTLLVGAVCTSCTDGSCPTCKGLRLCQECTGSGLCQACEGRGGEWVLCQKCICPACKGTKFCVECKGRGSLICPTCKGSGNGKEDSRFDPCTSCGGRGYKEGLKGANGGQARIPCLKCNGRGGVYVTVRPPCPTCQGKKQIACPNCRGFRACPNCRGMGRLPTCDLCNGQGRFLESCPVCQGDKNCVACEGTKACATCQGQGTCKDCFGKNAVIRYRMPIDRRWLVSLPGRAVRPTKDGLAAVSITGNTATALIDGRNVSIEVPDGCLLWLSQPQDLRHVSALFGP